MTDFAEAIRQIQENSGIDKDLILKTVEESLLAAYKKKCTPGTDIRLWGILNGKMFGSIFTGHRPQPGARGYLAFDLDKEKESYTYESGADIKVTSISDFNKKLLVVAYSSPDLRTLVIA